MQLGSSRKGRLRNRLIVVVLAAVAGGTAWRVVTRKPQLPAPAPEPPRLGYSTNGSTRQHATAH
ncbi:hypothetical protein [Nocardia macrotermitis]|uniref:hypothetical protein n=1 Tax=Nocardia macrotermitis TaxID=2585198 RepID=UPI001295BBC4|nr:hypothetical protein [Nocardia macrotermitis]